MKGLFNFLGKFLAFIFAILLVVALPIVVLGYDVGRVIFDQPTVTKITTEIVTESDLIPLGLNWYSETQAERRYASGAAEAWVGEPDIVHLISFMDTEDWRKIRWEVLPNEILEKWVASTVDGVYVWVDSDETVPQVTWDMTDFIKRVDSEHGLTAITTAYNALPPCTDEQIADFKSRLAAAPAGTKVLYNLCQFPDPWKQDQFGDYQESLEDVVANIPKQFNLTAELAAVSDENVGIGALAIKEQILTVRMVMKYAPLVPLALLVLIALLAVRSLRSLGLWWGVPLMLSSLFILISGLAYRAIIVGILSAGVLSEVPPLIMEEAMKGILKVAKIIFSPMVWQGVIILAVGVVLFVVGRLKKAKPAAEDSAG